MNISPQFLALGTVIGIELFMGFFVWSTNKMLFSTIKHRIQSDCLTYFNNQSAFGLELALIGFSLIITTCSFYKNENYKIEIFNIESINPVLSMVALVLIYIFAIIFIIFHKNKLIISKKNELKKEKGFFKAFRQMRNVLQNNFPLIIHNFIGSILLFFAIIIILNLGKTFIQLF